MIRFQFYQFLFIFFLLCSIHLNAQVKVANDADLATPTHPSAILEVLSEDRGFLPPRLTKVQRDAIPAPAEGLTIYNTTENCINVFNGAAWNNYCELRYSTTCSCVEYLNDYGLATEAWIPIAPPPGFDHDWYEQGTTSEPDNITDNIFTQGRVGIGIPAPLQDLHVAGNVRSDSRIYYFGATQRLQGDNNSALHYFSNNATLTQFLLRDNAGNQHGRLYGSGGGTNFGLMDQNGQWIFLSQLGSRLIFRISNDEKVRITAAGNMGVGVAAPSENIDVLGTARLRGIAAGISSNEVVVVDANGVLRKMPAAGLGLNDHDWYAVGTTAAPGAITDNIFTQGNTGIGITNPAEQLHVAGAIRTDARRVFFGAGQELYGNNADRLEYSSNSATLTKILHFNNAGVFFGGMVGHNNGSFGMNDRDDHWTFRAVHDQYLTMSIDNSEKVRILTNGNMGVGTNAPTNTIDVNGTARVRTLGVGAVSDQVVVADANGVLRQLPSSGLGLDDHDWYGVGTTAAPGAITDNIYTQGNTGIGITAPAAGLHLVDNDGIIASGTISTGIAMPAGAGVRMVWSSRNGAFRAGQVAGTQWDQANTGPYSTAFGNNTTASGNYTFAAGNGATASGNNAFAYGSIAQATGGSSIAMGNTANASNANTIALGFQTEASGNASIAIGYQADATGTGSKTFGAQTIASGFNAIATGEGTFARSRGELSIGAFSTDYTPFSATGFDNRDRIFSIGIGTNAANRRNAIEVRKGGSTIITGNVNLTQPINNPTITSAFILRNFATAGNALSISQLSGTSTSTAFLFNNWGRGPGIQLNTFSNSNTATALDVNTGSGRGVLVSLSSATNGNDGMFLFHAGIGRGILSQSNNAANPQPALMGLNNGTGEGVFGAGTLDQSGVKGTNYKSGASWWSVNPNAGIKEAGVSGTTDSGIAGVSGSVWKPTVAGLNNTQGGYFTASYGPVGPTVATFSFARVAYVDAGGTPRKIDGTGVAGTIVTDLDEEPVLMSSLETPEILFSDFGRGQLVNGKAIIKLDPIYSKNIVVDENNHMKVFVQLEGNCEGVYVTNKTADGFEVMELRGGTSNAEFSYMVTANRANVKAHGTTIKYDSSKRFAKGPKAIPMGGDSVEGTNEEEILEYRKRKEQQKKQGSE